jgi:hypothetical protein
MAFKLNFKPVDNRAIVLPCTSTTNAIGLSQFRDLYLYNAGPNDAAVRFATTSPVSAIFATNMTIGAYKDVLVSGESIGCVAGICETSGQTANIKVTPGTGG